MKRYFIALLLLCSLSRPLLAAVPAQTLVDEGKFYDNKSVEVQGEAIGDIMQRQNKCWLNVLTPEGTALGVLCPKGLVSKVKVLGNYKWHGDTVLVKGLFHRFYKDQGGETMIEAYDLQVVAPGYQRAHPLKKARIFLSLLFLVLGLVLTVVYRRISSGYKTNKRANFGNIPKR